MWLYLVRLSSTKNFACADFNLSFLFHNECDRPIVQVVSESLDHPWLPLQNAPEPKKPVSWQSEENVPTSIIHRTTTPS